MALIALTGIDFCSPDMQELWDEPFRQTIDIDRPLLSGVDSYPVYPPSSWLHLGN